MEYLRTASLRGLDRLVTGGYDLEVRNLGNLEVLRDRPKCPAVVIFNHTIADDPLIIFKPFYDIVPERLNNVVIPVSEEYTRFSIYPAYAAAVVLIRKLWSIDTPGVVQSYRCRTDGSVSESLSQRSSELGRSLFIKLGEKLSSAPLILIAPEGHRSRSGQILPAEAGVGVIAQMMEKQKEKGRIEEGFFVPLGMNIGNFSGRSIQYNAVHKRRVELTVGRAITSGAAVSFAKVAKNISKDEPRVISHFLMAQVARLLPEDMQGVYHPDLIEDTFRGRFELRTIQGNVVVYDNRESEVFSQIQLQK